MSFHDEVLPAEQRSVLRSVGPVAAGASFHLGGGTAVALHLGHRRSLDFDWFTAEAVPDPMRLARRLQDRGLALDVAEVAAGTLHAVADGVRLTFLEYRYPLLRDLHDWPEYGCRILSLEDLACTKLSAVAGRGARRDFLDVYGLGTAGLTLEEMLRLYRTKYQTVDLGHVLMSLGYFDDAEREPMPEMMWDVEWDEVRTTIQRWVLEATP